MSIQPQKPTAPKRGDWHGDESSLDRRPRFSPTQRATVLQVSALAVIAYSVAVLVVANVTPDIGLYTLGTRIGVVSRPALQGPTPKKGDRIESLAGVPIDSVPRMVDTVAALRWDRDRFEPERVADRQTLAGCESPVALVGGAEGPLAVRVRYRPLMNPNGPPSTANKGEGEQFGPAAYCWVEVSDPPWQRVVVSLIWLAMDSMLFWVGWLVFRRRPEDDAAALFFLLCIVTIGAYMGGYHWQQIAKSPALTFVFAICAMSLPQITLHFYLIFPSPKRFVLRYPRLMLMGLYGVPALIQLAVLVTIGAVVRDFRRDGSSVAIESNLWVLKNLINCYLMLGGLMLLGCIVCLVHSYQTSRQTLQRNQSRWLLASALFATACVAYCLWLAIADFTAFALGGATWAMFGASFAFTCGYAVSIARYRLLRVEEVVQRGVYYLLISFVSGLAYYGLLLLAVGVLPWRAARTPQVQSVLMSTFVILLLLGLGRLRSNLLRLLDRRFYREHGRLKRAMRRMNLAVEQLVSLETVAQRSLVVAAETINGQSAAFYLHRAEGDFIRAAKLGPTDYPEQFAVGHPLVEVLQQGQQVQSKPGPTLPSDRVTPMLNKLMTELAQPLGSSPLKGFWLIGPRRQGMYDAADLEFLSALSEITVLALQSAETHQTLEQLNDELRLKVSRMARDQQRLVALSTASGKPDNRPGSKSMSADDGEPPIQVEDAPPPPVSEVPAKIDQFDLIRGTSPAVREMIRTLRKVAASEATVLIRGESGTGKSLLADVLHRNSPRADGPFVKVHCSALSPGVLESELFGHVKGAFTGAHRDKPGRFQLADGGTLFLDEIGDISLDVQTKLLRVLQERTFEPVGGTRSLTVDVRIVAATHQPLDQLIRQGKFREDLYYRLNVIGIRTPALRERREDILELAQRFLVQQPGADDRGFTDDAGRCLIQYRWPGNIRELQNVVQRAAILASDQQIGPESFPPELARGHAHTGDLGIEGYASSFDDSVDDPGDLDSSPAETGLSPQKSERAGAGPAWSSSHGLDDELQLLEQRRLVDALTAANGNKSKAARMLGLPRTTFTSRLKKFGIAT